MRGTLRFPQVLEFILVSVAFLSIACASGSAPPVPTEGPASATSVPASPTPTPVGITPTVLPTAVPATSTPPSAASPTGSVVVMPSGIASANSTYLDDRSNGASVIESYYNAINRHEYVRAYSYWQPGSAAGQLPSLAEFQKGYAQTASVQLMTGPTTEDVGAGQIHNSVPVTLIATLESGTNQTFVGCYRLHLARPEFQVVPPFQPRGIESATIQSVPNNADTATLMAQSCQ